MSGPMSLQVLSFGHMKGHKTSRMFCVMMNLAYPSSTPMSVICCWVASKYS